MNAIAVISVRNECDLILSVVVGTLLRIGLDQVSNLDRDCGVPQPLKENSEISS
jgi:hypothetical protein